MSKRIILAAVIAFLSIVILSSAARSQVAARAAIRVARPGVAGNVQLPYMWPDNAGNQWMIYNNGQLMQQGNMPIYSQGAMLRINNAYAQSRTNMAQMDEKTGELVLEGLVANNNVTVTRRILLNKEEGWVRYVDIIRNNAAQEQTLNVSYQTNTNYGVQSATLVPDPRKKEQNLAWVAMTQANNRVAVEMYGGKGAKSVPTLNYAQGNNSVTANCSLSVGGGKEVALMHFHMTTNSMETGQKFVLGMKETKILSSVPAAIRKLIVNFRGGDSFVGDYEILRGEMLDVVELRSGDQLMGTLQEKAFKLQTFYGTIDLTPEKVIGIINVGEYRPRQLVITKDGEIYGGRLERDRLSLQLSSGQVTEIPLSQVTRMGYRKRAGESEEWTFEKPLVLMRSGDRICVQMPAKDIDVVTRYGPLKLKPQTVAAVNFQSEETGVHQIFLTDGSYFAGLVLGDAFEMKLAGDGPEQVAKFPAASIRRLQFSTKIDETDDETPALHLANDDTLIGTLVGALKLDTAFSTIDVNAQEIKRLTHTAGAPSDVQVVLWDETTVSGQLQEQQLICKLKSGVEITVPVALMEEYSQPRPQPSAAVIETIRKLVAEMNADDWKQRDLARERLTTMGPIVIGTLQQLRGSQPLEAQQGIDLILQQLEKSKEKAAEAGASAVPQPMPMILRD